MRSDGGVRLLDDPAEPGTARLDGIVTGRFTDHHVHLQLVDHTLLAGSRLARVVDLGATPEWVAALAHHDPGDPSPVAVEYAGAFLTAPGGYPSDRAWAPEGSVREIPDAAAATRAVDELAAGGASVIKVVAHGDGPVLDDETFCAAVRAAAAHDLPVVAHAEGRGQAQRAGRLGAQALAHAPFSERLTGDEIAEQAASVAWVSTLAVHDDAHSAIAIDNVRRFSAAGGTVLYGTDMGNGDTPVDLRESEIAALNEAGVRGIRLLTALAPSSPLVPGVSLLFLPAGDPQLARPLTTIDPED
ncbi:hydrolase [Microbacterium sp. NPDC058342]|uniref:hydrolase n=1 Tax=Microbacterium sp. NPDC058342 TaxID=3346454 RepID=UPI003654D058